MIGPLWLTFCASWAIAAIMAKRSHGIGHRRRYLTSRLVIIALLICGFIIPKLRRFLIHGSALASSPVAQAVAVLLGMLGFGLAIWARMSLGRNWGDPMSICEEPELITNGPYHWIRHPIYTGVIVAMLGSSLVGGRLWVFFLVVLAVLCSYSAFVEERLLNKQFPSQYPEYKRRTKMFIPLVL